MADRSLSLHDYSFTTPLTLRPSSGPDELFNAMVVAASLRAHVDMLDVQAWALSFANEWESRFFEKGFARFSLGYGDISGLEKVPYVQAWFLDRKITYVREWASVSGDWTVSEMHRPPGAPAFEDHKLLSEFDGFILKEMNSFPVEPRQRRWSFAFCSPEGFTLPEWRQSILNLLDPADLARYEQIELGVETQATSQEKPPTRL